MSIISDPANKLATNKLASNRALLLLAHVSYEPGTGSSVSYSVYQLQTIQTQNGKSEIVLARRSALGNIPLQLGSSDDFSATDSVAGIFIAGGLFSFDLDTSTEIIGTEGKRLLPALLSNAMCDQRTIAIPCIDTTDIGAVIGVVTLFQGLVVACVNQEGLILYRPSLLESGNIHECQVGHKKGLVASYWVSDSFSSTSGCRIAWNIAKNDGKVYCWSVPCTNAQSSCGSNGEQTNVRGCRAWFRIRLDYDPSHCSIVHPLPLIRAIHPWSCCQD